MEHALFITKLSNLKYWGRKYNRLYYGTEFCENLLPTKDELIKVIKFTKQNKLNLTFVTPFVTNKGIKTLLQLFKLLEDKMPSSEIVVNDFGVLNLLDKSFDFSELILGRLLNKQKRGPQILDLLGKMPEEALEHFRRSNIEVPILQDFLIKHNIKRVELDNLLQGLLVDSLNMKKSLYMPYGYITTTRYCLANGSKDEAKKDWIAIFPCKKECQGFEVVLTHKSMPVPLYLKGNTQFFKNETLPNNSKNLNVDRIVYQPEIPI